MADREDIVSQEDKQRRTCPAKVRGGILATPETAEHLGNAALMSIWVLLRICGALRLLA